MTRGAEYNAWRIEQMAAHYRNVLRMPWTTWESAPQNGFGSDLAQYVAVNHQSLRNIWWS